MARSGEGRVQLLPLTLFWLFATFATAQSPSFLSIDCGAEKSYTDGAGIEWVTDEGFISSGSTLTTSLSPPRGQEAYFTSRYFPDARNKHCYVLPAVVGNTYLIRAVILHGGASELSLPVQFGITVNSNDWFTFILHVEDANIQVPLTFETILYNDRDHIDVCINKATQGTSWISSLELRVMPSGSYELTKTADKLLVYLFRYNVGISSGYVVRWPDDEYDRVWFAGSAEFSGFDRVSNTSVLSNVTSFAEVSNKPPDAVMMDAIVGSNLSLPQQLWMEGVKETYVAIYFRDIGDVTASVSNPVGMLVSIEDFTYNLNITDDQPFQVTHYTNVTGNNVNITIAKQPWFKGDTFLNAFEIYEVTAIKSNFTLGNDVSALQVLQTSLGLTSWTGDPCYPVPYNWVTCDGNSRISVLRLSNENITGTIPSNIGNLTGLREIYMENNNISGPIPTSLSLLPSLTVLALDNNSMSGEIPSAFRNRVGFTFSGNPNLTLCQSTDTECTNTDRISTTGEKSKTGLTVGVAVGGALAVVLVIVLIVLWVRRRNPKPTPETKNDHKNGTLGAGVSKLTTIQPTARASAYQVAGFIPVNEVVSATQNFQKQIGEGGYGPVYYGKLANGREVAVKVNKIGNHQGNDEFVNEVSLLTRVHHKNLVSLIGFCEEGDERILIYEYLRNGTLRDHLYGPEAAVGPLTWKARLEIALDAARGLEYLHVGCTPRIIHRDVKSNNILIGDNMVAKVADFGLSKSTPDQQTTKDGQFSTMVKGTPGYLDPEYYLLQRLSQKSDVYSFGVVLAEIISGRRPLSLNPDGSQFYIINLVRECMETGDIASLADPALNGHFNPESMQKMAEIALSCVEREGVRRPNMAQVVRSLTEAYEMDIFDDPDHSSMDSRLPLPSQRSESPSHLIGDHDPT